MIWSFFELGSCVLRIRFAWPSLSSPSDAKNKHGYPAQTENLIGKFGFIKEVALSAAEMFKVSQRTSFPEFLIVSEMGRDDLS